MGPSTKHIFDEDVRLDRAHWQVLIDTRQRDKILGFKGTYHDNVQQIQCLNIRAHTQQLDKFVNKDACSHLRGSPSIRTSTFVQNLPSCKV